MDQMTYMGRLQSGWIDGWVSGWADGQRDEEVGGYIRECSVW